MDYEMMDYEINKFVFNNIFNNGVVISKIIQWIYCRTDILPNDIIQLMKPFLNNVPINQGYLKECYNNYSNLGRILGSGTTAFVFELLQDDKYVIKIYKNKNIQHEIFFLKKLFEIITLSFNINNFFPNSELIDLRIIDFAGFLNILEKQINYNNEFNNFKCLRNIFQNINFIILPEIKNFQIENNEIIMNKINGFTFLEIEKMYSEYIIDFRVKCLIAYFWMIRSQCIHLDLHDGNLLYLIDQKDDQNNKVAILDYGMLITTGPIYWNLWKSYCKKDTNQINSILQQFIIESIYNEDILSQIKNLNLFKNTKYFTDWLDDLLIQLNKYGLKVKAETSIILLNFIFLGKCRVIEDDEENFEIELIDYAINKMINSENNKLYNLGVELQNDIQNIFL